MSVAWWLRLPSSVAASRPLHLAPLLAYPGSRGQSTSSQQGTSDVLEQLRRVEELQSRVGQENSKSQKEAIIAEYPDLRELLEHVYDPNFRSNLSFESLNKHLKLQRAPLTTSVSSVVELSDKLSTREIVGHAAKDLVVTFLRNNGVLNEDGTSTSEYQTFGRLLDRNLVAGFGAKTLSAVQWETSDTDTRQQHKPKSSVADQAASGQTHQLGEVSTSRTGTITSTKGKGRNMKSFAVALGKSIDPPFSDIEQSLSTCKWFASRKLDGVRVITVLDFSLPDNPADGDANGIELANVEFRSRTGKAFTSLANVEKQLHRLSHFPNLRGWLDRDDQHIERKSGVKLKRLVLDGEVCVMRERKGSTSSHPDDGTGAGAIWADHDLEEDFTSTVSEIRRQAPYTIAHPVYFIFDILNQTMFDAGRGASTFGQRVQDIRELGRWLASGSAETMTGGHQSKVLRPLAQWEVNHSSEIEGMVARAAEEGWEGLVLRADRPYKGSRSSDIRKFKQWLDAEYTVIGIENSVMRLSVSGAFGEHDAMANIWIEHKGVKVSVGSGFTAEQRIRFAKAPQDIIGKEVTVEYFSESASAGREGMSLRFPRVKQIWEEGRRTV